MRYYSRLTGEVVGEDDLDLMIDEHIEMFDDVCDEYDILQNIFVYENGITETTVFNLIFE